MALLPSFTYGFSYDVFLSFRGMDTRFGFIGNLYKALCDKGIHTFIDDEELQRGDEITPSLVKAIEESRIAIPVFSNNYASSSFCLDELVTIIELVKANGRLVLPVFYNVDPSNVRRQSGSYGEALAKHEERFRNNKENFMDNMDRLGKWKMALNQAANFSGEHFKLGNEYEHQFIAKIVKLVSNKINRIPLHVASYPVGLESRKLEVNLLLDFAYDNGVYMVGIYGIGGMGKSTLARALYNSIADHFDCSCFLHNVRENSAKHGLVHLQEKLLFDTIGLNIKLGDVNEGIPIVKHRLHRKKVLLILDDVDELKQLQVMAGGADWFGLGSRVIITTRDKHLLASHGVERTYEVHGLNKEEALELFRWNAFKNCKVNPRYGNILKRAVTYASGLPLALEVIGSNLFGRSIEEWKSTLDRYERIPNKDIQKTLKVSFDALDEDEQSVFLDIVCCFKGYTLAMVKDILHAHHDYCMRHQIGVLVEKSLIEIIGGMVTCHDLIEDMGKEIVRLESPKEPGKRSRLWSPKDIVHVLEDNAGTSKIEIIHLDAPSFEEIEWDGEAFKKMKNLKTLIIRNGHFSKGPKHLPSCLRVLEWQRYPSKYLPSDFHPKRLVILKLPDNCIKSFEFAGLLTKKLMNLKVLNFDWCECLKEIPDVSGLSNLEEFSFQWCQNLTRIHDSIGFLNKLKYLSANGCSSLRSFPPMKLTSLRRLDLSVCGSLEDFPEILGKMENITDLILWRSPIKELPFSIQNLSRLQKLQVAKLGMFKLPSSILMLPELGTISLISFLGFECCLLTKQDKGEGELSSMVSSNVISVTLFDCNLSDQLLPICLTWFANVKELNLSRNNFTTVPECIKECPFLWNLKLDDCFKLEDIRGIPPNLKYLSARNCKFLTSISETLLLNQKILEAGNTDFQLAGAEVTLFLKHQRRGSSISFWIQNKLPAIAICLASQLTDKKSYEDFHFKDSIRVTMIINRLHRVPLNFGMPMNDMKLLELQRIEFYLSKEDFENEFNHVEIAVEGLNSAPVIVESGIHVLKEKCTSKDVRLTDPNSKRKSDDDLHSSKSPSLSLLTMEVSEKEFVQQQQRMTLLSQQQHMFQHFFTLQKLMNLKVLNFDWCECLREIPDVSGMSNLEEFSFQWCQNLTRIHDSIGFLDKLKYLSASGCSSLRSFPPMKLTSLRRLDLSFCGSLEDFPEILGKMENITDLILWHTPIKELPFSIQNLTRLQKLQVARLGMVKLPSSILMLPELGTVSFEGSEVCLLTKQDKGEGELRSMVSSNVIFVYLFDCNLSDQLLSICLTWFANVKELDLSRNNFTTVPECIKECCFLWNLRLDDCFKLEDIRGIPPNLKYLSARNCKFLTSISESLLLNQKILEAGNTDFQLAGAEVTLFLKHQRRGASISFWIQNKLPAIAICLASQLTDKNSYEDFHFKDSILVTMIINRLHRVPLNFGIPMNDMKLLELQRIEFYLSKEDFENELNHVEITVEGLNSAPVLVESGIHILKEKCTSKEV